jgi:hypothetical protein
VPGWNGGWEIPDIRFANSGMTKEKEGRFWDDDTYFVILNLIQDLLVRGEIPDIR